MPTNPAADAASQLSRSTALLTTGLNQLHTLISQISGQVAGIVRLYSPVAFIKFELAAKDATAAVGRILTPALEKFTLLVRGIGDVFASLSPEAQKLIQAATAAAIGIGLMTAAMVALDLAINTSLGGLPGLLGLVAGGAVGMAFALKDLAAIQRIVESGAKLLSTVMNFVGVAAQVVADAFRPVLGVFEQMGAKIQPFVDQLAAKALPIIQGIATQLASAFAQLLPSLTALLPTLGMLADTVLKNIAGTVAALIPFVTTFVQALLEMAPAVGTLLQGFSRFQSAIVQALLPVLKTLLDLAAPLRTAFSYVFTVVGTILSGVSGLLTGLAAGLQAILKPIIDAITNQGGAFTALQKSLSDLGPALGVLAVELGKALGSLLTSITPLVPIIMGPLLTAMELFATAVRGVAVMIGFLASELNDLLGTGGGAAPPSLNTFKPGASQGMAVRDVGSSDIMSMIRKQQETALMSGRGGEENPAIRSAGYLQSIDTKMENLPDKLAAAIGKYLANKGSQVAEGPVGQAAPFFGMAGVGAREYARSITG
jgi:phage-related protein